MLIFMFNHVAAFCSVQDSTAFFNNTWGSRSYIEGSFVHNTKSNISSSSQIGYKKLFSIIAFVKNMKESVFLSI